MEGAAVWKTNLFLFSLKRFRVWTLVEVKSLHSLKYLTNDYNKIFRWRNYYVMEMHLNQTIFPSMNVSQSFKTYVILEDLNRKLYFNHFTIISCLHQKISYWLVKIFFITWNKRVHVTIILYVSCQLVICLMT